jgi:site-specific recombinase XerD
VTAIEAIPPAAPTQELRVAEAAERFIAAAEDGRVRNRSGRHYRPSALRDLRGCLRHQVARDVGHVPLRDVRRQHIQALVDRLAADGLSLSRIRSVVSAVRALYGWAIEQEYVEFSPADALVLPQTYVTPEEPEPKCATADEWTEPIARTPPPRTPPRRRSGAEFQPLAVLPERLMSFVLRAVTIGLALMVFASIASSL